MEIKIIKRIEPSELVEKIRNVPLIQKAQDGSEIKVYEKARISIRELHPSEVNPTTFYLLRPQLKLQKDLRECLMKKHGIDLLHLEGALEIVNEQGELWTLTPPIVEVTPRDVKYCAREGEIEYNDTARIQIPIINDGAHRVFTAIQAGETFHGVYITGADERFPFYAHPNEWSRIKIFDAMPTTKQEKKFYSRDDCYALYRNFDVLGCGKPRTLGT
ncbi:hypothetical protein KY349_03810 [Candidatus Woesearchaeota archaeon]|nr:hypothetical protein [Candidatus Woesearchaeota archaeon]